MTSISMRQTRAEPTRIDVSRKEAALVTGVLAALVIWLPLQTPIAMAAYQYGGLSAESARAILLAKDAVVGVLLLVLLMRHGRAYRWHWFDLFAAAYVGLLVIYSVVPQLLGSGLPPAAVAASFREFVVPVELYLLGRFALLAGADERVVVSMFIAAAALAATFTVLQYVLIPVAFWSSTLDLVSFVREVQGRPEATSLAGISLVGSYGIPGQPEITRAVGTFTHPVGAAYYFVVPLLLSVAASLAAVNSGARRHGLLLLLVVALFVAAVITPISRGSWITAGVGTLICGLLLRRRLATVAALAAVSAFLVLTPPFSYSISSAIGLQDPSTLGHQQEVERGVETVLDNPLGLGVGHGDAVFGATFVDEEELTDRGVAGRSVGENIGENMYLAILASVGPVGLTVFLMWLLGVGAGLLRGKRDRREWVRVGLFAALAGLAVSSLTASPFMRFTTAASFWLLVGLYTQAPRYSLPEWWRLTATRTSETAARARSFVATRKRGS